MKDSYFTLVRLFLDSSFTPKDKKREEKPRRMKEFC